MPLQEFQEIRLQVLDFIGMDYGFAPGTVEPGRPTRRYYSPQLKVEIIQECRQSSASVAGVALAHGINANIVHRWLHEDERAALLLPVCQSTGQPHEGTDLEYRM